MDKGYFRSESAPTSQMSDLGERDDSPHTVATSVLPGMVVTLTGAGGKYCTAEESTHCHKVTTGTWEHFHVVDGGDGYIALKGGSHCESNCHLDDSVKFKAVDAGEGKVAFQNKKTGRFCTDSGKVWCAAHTIAQVC